MPVFLDASGRLTAQDPDNVKNSRLMPWPNGAFMKRWNAAHPQAPLPEGSRCPNYSASSALYRSQAGAFLEFWRVFKRHGQGPWDAGLNDRGRMSAIAQQIVLVALKAMHDRWVKGGEEAAFWAAVQPGKAAGHHRSALSWCLDLLEAADRDDRTIETLKAAARGIGLTSTPTWTWNPISQETAAKFLPAWLWNLEPGPWALAVKASFGVASPEDAEGRLAFLARWESTRRMLEAASAALKMAIDPTIASVEFGGGHDGPPAADYTVLKLAYSEIDPAELVALLWAVMDAQGWEDSQAAPSAPTSEDQATQPAL